MPFLPSVRRLVPAAAAAAVAAAALSGCGSTRPSRITSVFPLPGSRVASPQTQIVFRGVRVAELGKVLVTGSRSGRHSGRLLADSDGRGGSFLPSKPFAAGEQVTVRTQPRVPGGGHSFSFAVATPAGGLPNRPLPPIPRVPGDVLSFRSRPDLAPASVEIIRPQSATASQGDIFIAPQQGPLQNGPMIVDPRGGLVWFHALPKGTVATDFRVQRYQGKPALTWWQGHLAAGVGVGEDVVVGSRYRPLAVVRAANGLSADLHEFDLSPDGRALITAYYPVHWDASSVGGPTRAIVLDSVVQEIDVKTGLLLFQWDSLDHVPLSESYQRLPKDPGQPYDYFHVNSIQRTADGKLVISARNTWAAYEVDPRQGAIIWRLGGKRSTFKLASGASFAFQHHVRARGASGQVVTVFDDGAGPPQVHAQSRGLTLELNLARRVVSIVEVDRHTPPLLANYEGNLQDLPNGDQFLGWGQQPYFTEFSPGGRIVFDGRFTGANSSYRAFRFPWHGTPVTPPAIIATRHGASTNVYVSWNGATGVSSWQLLAGNSSTSLQPLETVPRQGFETHMTGPARPYVAVRALAGDGRVLASTPVAHPG